MLRIPTPGDTVVRVRLAKEATSPSVLVVWTSRRRDVQKMLLALRN